MTPDTLEKLLSTPPPLKRGEFVDAARERISRCKRQRRAILALSWLAALVIAPVFMPWRAVQSLLANATASFYDWSVRVSDSLGMLDLPTTNEQTMVLVVVLGLLLLAVCWTLQEE